MSFFAVTRRLPLLWYRPRLAVSLWLLLPLSLLFFGLVVLRRWLYRCGVLVSQSLPVPVIVVGNLTVGGSGKTPLVLWLVERLRAQGWQPGIISRGYGGAQSASNQFASVTSASAAAMVGDEPLLLAQRSGVPVFVGLDRVAAGLALLAAHPQCDVIVSDDGLQHYRLRRAAEIAVFDARGAGNARLLPAGPLREPMSRLSTLSAVVFNSTEPILGQAFRPAALLPKFVMRLQSQCFQALGDSQKKCTAEDLRGKRLHAVAGIGDPSRFFAQLEALGLEFEAHPFADHHAYTAEDLCFSRDAVLLMTEKDAVKCAPLPLTSEVWVLPVAAQIEAAVDGRFLLDIILEKIDGRSPA